MNMYIGNESQLYGVEEVRLVGGKGDGMRFYNVRNGGGLEFSICLDRCADIYRVSFKGVNMGYFSPAGYVAPSYYDHVGAGFLKSFTAGFLTTCGLTAVGNPCTDDGEELPLHGTVSNIPAENAMYWIDDEAIHIKITVRDASMFTHQLILEREYICPIGKNEIMITDTVKNIGSRTAPFEILYHCNMGYPLLSEEAEIKIPSTEVVARNAHSEIGIEDCLKVESPQNGYVEKCYYHKLDKNAEVSIYNPAIGKGVKLSYDASELPLFTQWKMMGQREYVMGLEPGNAYPDGRADMRERGLLDTLKSGEEKVKHLKFTFVE